VLVLVLVIVDEVDAVGVEVVADEEVKVKDVVLEVVAEDTVVAELVDVVENVLRLDEVEVEGLVVVDVEELELEPELVDELESVDEVVEVEDDVMVDTDVVADDVKVDVCVVDGDVTSQLRNVPFSWRATSSFNALLSKPDRDCPEGMASSASGTASITWTTPIMSRRHPISKRIPSCRPSSC